MREAALYGAEVIKITGTYDQTKELAARFAKAKGVFLDRGIKSVAAIEAMKTMAYEIAEQLGRGTGWRPALAVAGLVHSGRQRRHGADRRGQGLPRDVRLWHRRQNAGDGHRAVGGCAPMVEAYKRGQRIATPIDNPQTIIATLATGNPGRAYEMLYDYVADYGGAFRGRQ
jgi:threonine synthase